MKRFLNIINLSEFLDRISTNEEFIIDDNINECDN